VTHTWQIRREPSLRATTFGALYVDGVWRMWTLEDELRGRLVPKTGFPSLDAWVRSWKIDRMTAIPAGEYAVVLSRSARFGRETPELLAVPGFSGIRMHRGNFATDTEGCPIVGYGRDDDAPGRPMITAGTTTPAEAELVARLRRYQAAGDACRILIQDPMTV